MNDKDIKTTVVLNLSELEYLTSMLGDQMHTAELEFQDEFLLPLIDKLEAALKYLKA